MRTVLARIAAAAAALSILFGGVAAAQQYQEPSQSVTVRGDTAVVEGRGCDPLADVSWTLHTGSNSTSPAVDAGGTQADARGHYRFTIDISDRRGRHTVRTQCGDLVQQTSFKANGGGGQGGAQQSSARAAGRVLAATDAADVSASGGGGGDVVPLASARLAFTGGDAIGLAIRGAALVAAGLLLVVYRRRRRALVDTSA